MPLVCALDAFAATIIENSVVTLNGVDGALPGLLLLYLVCFCAFFGVGCLRLGGETKT